MKEIVPGVFLLRGFPPCGFNVFLLRSGDRCILVDTASRHAVRRILRQLPGELEAIVITHAHHDHAGAMHAVATTTGAPVWAGAGDVDAVEGRVPEPLPEAHRENLVNRTFGGWWRDRHPVARALGDGDPVGDFTVVTLPGHTPGHIGLWRERDRTLICGDAMRSMNLFTGIPSLGEMPNFFTVDEAESRRSIHKMAALEAKTICFGHGAPMMRNAAERIATFAAHLPEAAAAGPAGTRKPVPRAAGSPGR